MFVVINKYCGKENMAEAEKGSEFSFKEAVIVLSVVEEFLTL